MESIVNYWLHQIILVSSTVRMSHTSGHTDHGVDHWLRVYANTQLLLEAGEQADPDVIGLFAVFHDSMRESEFEDHDHGRRGYLLARELGATRRLLPAQDALLIHACVHHDTGGTHSDPTIAVCWDADRLDLPRVGIKPDPELLSTATAKEQARTWNTATN